MVAEVNRTAARNIGLNFSYTNNAGITVFTDNTGGLINNGSGTGGAGGLISGGLNFASNSGANILAVLNNGKLPLLIQAMRDLNLARSWTDTNLVALNGTPAYLQSGGEFPVPVVTGQTLTGLQGVSFIPFGVQMAFVPYVYDKDKIRLNINANVSTRDVSQGTTIGNSSVPGLTTRNFQNVVELRDGETLAIGGLIQTNLGSQEMVIPGIGDLPILGNLAGLKNTSAGEQELLILIKPELQHPLPPCKEVPLPGSDMFEANDVEFYLLGRLESHFPVDYRSPIRDDCSRIMQYHEIEKKYVIGGETGFSTDHN